MRRARAWIWGVSLAVHVAGALVLAHVHPSARREPTSIAIRSVTRPRHAHAPPPPPPPPAARAPEARRAPRPVARRAPAPPPPVAPTAPVPDAPFVPASPLTLGNDGPGGIPVGPAAPAPSAPRVTHAAGPRVLAPPPHPAASDGCDEDATRPRPLSVPQPVFPEQARADGIAGRVRVEITIDEEGHVVSARVLEGLGHGLDESALDAARGATFEPASRCGHAVRATFVIGIRFSL